MMYHYETKNLGFLKLANELKRLGVKNNCFILNLYDENLRDVDPLYDPNLTTIQKARILLECSINPWYFFREVVRIDTTGLDVPTEQFPINRGTLAILYTALNGISHIVRLPRESYRDITYKVLFTYLFLFGPTGNRVDLINSEAANNSGIIDFIRTSIKYLPEYFSTQVVFTDNLKAFTNYRLNTCINKVKIPRSYYEAEHTIGRGMTANMQYYYEADFNKYFYPLYCASLPGFSELSRKNREQNTNKPCATMISSYINENEMTESSQVVEHMIGNAGRWKDQYYDLSMDELNAERLRNCANGFMYINYDYNQLGKDDAWFDMQCKMMNMDQGKINRNLLLKR